jgi:hypothetical protein
MDTLERAGGPEYDIGTDPGEPDWVATRRARFELERARKRSAEHGVEIPNDRSSCRESTSGGHALGCE